MLQLDQLRSLSAVSVQFCASSVLCVVLNKGTLMADAMQYRSVVKYGRLLLFSPIFAVIFTIVFTKP